MAIVPVSHLVLKWARESAGLTVSEAARKLNIQAARGVSPAERLEALEAGNESPSRPLLLRMSRQYRRPLIAFYLETPPIKGDRGEDFRRLPTGFSEIESGLVDALLRDIRARQSIIRAVMDDEGETGAIPFVGATAMDAGMDNVSTHIRGILDFNLGIFRARPVVSEAFSYLRAAIEATGVFVLLIGDLGSHHTQLSVEAFRGFALADPIAPFIVVNDQDARAAWSFTLLHEFTHLCLGQTGISGGTADTEIEQFCNDVAGALLLPAGDLLSLEISQRTDFERAVERISIFASARNISRSMVAYKLYRTQQIGFDQWNALRAEFRRQWLEHRAEKRRRSQEDHGGPDYYVVRRQRIGPALLDVVSRMVASGALSSIDAGRVLGVRPQNIYELVQPR